SPLASRKQTLDLQSPISARDKFLHVASRSGSAAACHLHRLAFAQDARRYCCRRALCYSFDLYSLGAQLHLCRVWKYPLDRCHLLRTETSGPCDCCRSRHSDRKQGTQERGHVVARLGCVRHNLFFPRPIPFDHHQCRHSRPHRQQNFARIFPPRNLPPLVSATLGALVTTWTTFVPCFLWVFLGAPYIEKLREVRLLTAALSTVTAAVVGVILNLAVWFGLHVIFPGNEKVDWFALGLCA